LTSAGVGVFQQELEQDQQWIFSIGTGPEAGVGVIFHPSAFEILMFIYILRDGVKQEQESIIFLYSGVIPGAGINF